MAKKNIQRNPMAERIAKAILNEYKPTNVEEMQDAIKDVFGPMFEAMLQGEMDSHLGYTNNDHAAKNTTNRRNGYTNKTLKTSFGHVDIKAPRDREGSFDPVSIPKRTTDVSGIEDKVISMYTKGMSDRYSS